LPSLRSGSPELPMVWLIQPKRPRFRQQHHFL
jgi:hypothetical protein